MKKDQKVYLVSNGDVRKAAGVACWPKQEETLKLVKAAFTKLGVATELLTKYDAKQKHGFLTKQCEGAAILSKIEPTAPIVVVLSCWAYAHNICGPLMTHKGPILLMANFDGTWPGLVSLLNHAATLERLSVKHSRIWSDNFVKDEAFMKRLATWCKNGEITYDESHVVNANTLKLSPAAKKFGETLAKDILREKRIMGQFDPGCMGMLNAIINPGKLGAIGMPVEYLNQSDLLAEMNLVSDEEAQGYLNWLVKKGTWFDWGHDMFTQLTPDQVLSQMKMYAAAARIYQRFGLSSVGIPYQNGLARCCPASDLVEGMLNNSDRPDVRDPETKTIVEKGKPIVHFNEGDIGSGIPQVLMRDIYLRKNMAPETTLHDIRWGRDFEDKFTWVFLISGAAPPAHWNGCKHTSVYRQAKEYFPKGGGTCTGISKPGVITWARFYERFGEIGMDCGTGEVVDLPEGDLNDRLVKTNKEWPIANCYIPGYGRDQLMATHMSNHITIGYGDILQELVATCQALGISTRVAGDAKDMLR